MFRFFYLSTSGRCGRQVYWLGYLLPCLAIGLLLGLFFAPLLSKESQEIALVTLVAVLFWPSTAMMVKRLHDLGLSGWFSAFAWVPYIGPIVWIGLGLMPGSKGDNRYGPDPAGNRQEMSSAI